MFEYDPFHSSLTTDENGLIRILAGIARACPGVSELSIVHVSRISVILLCVADKNKAHREVGIWLPGLQRYISTFKTLSTIILIYGIGKAWVTERLALLWNKAKDLALSELRRSSVGGPKILRAVTMANGDKFGPKLVLEEVVV